MPLLPHYWTFWGRDLPGLRNQEGLVSEMSSSVTGSSPPLVPFYHLFYRQIGGLLFSFFACVHAKGLCFFCFHLTRFVPFARGYAFWRPEGARCMHKTWRTRRMPLHPVKKAKKNVHHQIIQPVYASQHLNFQPVISY